MSKVFFTQFSESEIRSLMRDEFQNVLRESKIDSKPSPKQLLNIDEAAELLDLAKQTIYGLVSNKQIPHFKQGQKLRFKRSELEAWVESGRVKTQTEFANDVESYLSNPKSKD